MNNDTNILQQAWDKTPKLPSKLMRFFAYGMMAASLIGFPMALICLGWCVLTFRYFYVTEYVMIVFFLTPITGLLGSVLWLRLYTRAPRADGSDELRRVRRHIIVQKLLYIPQAFLHLCFSAFVYLNHREEMAFTDILLMCALTGGAAVIASVWSGAEASSCLRGKTVGSAHFGIAVCNMLCAAALVGFEMSFVREYVLTLPTVASGIDVIFLLLIISFGLMPAFALPLLAYHDIVAVAFAAKLGRDQRQTVADGIDSVDS